MESPIPSFCSANPVPHDNQVSDQAHREETSSLPSENPETVCGKPCKHSMPLLWEPGCDKACGGCAVAGQQRGGGVLLGGQEALSEVEGGDQQVTEQRGPLIRGNSLLQGHRALQVLAQLRHGDHVQSVGT